NGRGGSHPIPTQPPLTFARPSPSSPAVPRTLPCVPLVQPTGQSGPRPLAAPDGGAYARRRVSSLDPQLQAELETVAQHAPAVAAPEQTPAQEMASSVGNRGMSQVIS